MKRLYHTIFNNHLKDFNQMIFIGGPRQVGKTTLAKELLETFPGIYLNWDDSDDRGLILGSYDTIVKQLPDPKLKASKPLVIMDEVHKYKGWKNHIKGFFDKYKDRCHIVLTGSAKLDTYKRGGDSLMGRYFSYTVCPLSVREISKDFNFNKIPSQPVKIEEDLFNQLWINGGFPEPFLKNSTRFFNMWQKLRGQQLFREDIRDASNIRDFMQFELFADLTKNLVGKSVRYTSLSKHVRVSDQTIRRWFDVLESNYYGFRLYPWTKNIARSLLKEPKFYLWDWSIVQEEGSKFENFVAVHLLKLVSYWNELGLENAGLYYLRTKDKKEIDFVITKNKKVWALVECKLSETSKLSPSLFYFKEQTRAQHAFQVVFDMTYIDGDCFAEEKPIIVPARTFLSQLI